MKDPVVFGSNQSSCRYFYSYIADLLLIDNLSFLSKQVAGESQIRWQSYGRLGCQFRQGSTGQGGSTDWWYKYRWVSDDHKWTERIICSFNTELDLHVSPSPSPNPHPLVWGLSFLTSVWTRCFSLLWFDLTPSLLLLNYITETRPPSHYHQKVLMNDFPGHLTVFLFLILGVIMSS